MNWEQVALVVGVLSPLLGVPMAMIALYLRAIRDHQTSGIGEIKHRIQIMDAAIHELLKSTADFEHQYTTKEEWVRESMFARQRMDRLTELVTRIQASLENGHGIAAELSRVATAMTQAMTKEAGHERE